MIAKTLEQIKNMAKEQAISLRKRSPEMTGTEIIAEENYIPDWNPNKDYSEVIIGAPVLYHEQVYTLVQQHNASHYAYPPTELPSLWRVAHTTNPDSAKPFVAPTSTSDMYLVNECMFWTDGNVYRCINANGTVYSPNEYAPDWEKV